MLNMLMALAVGGGTTALLALTGLLRWGEASVPGVVATGVALAVLARRSTRRLEAIFHDSARALQTMPPRFEVGIAILERGYPLARQQWGIKSQIDAQIGVLYFLQKDFSRALPYLKRALWFGHWLAGAMLAVVYYKKKDTAAMKKTLAVLTRRAGKQALAWSLHAYLLLQIGDRLGAQQVLADGCRRLPNEPRLREGLLAVQNGKRLRMRAYKEQWYQFHLEQPPADSRPSALQPRLGRIARRGRWS